MKKLVAIVFLLVFSFSLTQAQIVDPEKVVKKQGTKRTNKKIEKGVDKGFDKIEEGIGRLFGKKKKKKKKEKQSTQDANEINIQKQTAERQTANKPNVVWNKFDFVPGDVVIFEDGPSADEENGEFPSRWDLIGGVTEIAQVDGDNVILFSANGHTQGIIPYLKNSKEDYLPEIFTIEFDAHFNPNIYNERYYVNFYDKKNQKYGNNKSLTVYVNGLRIDQSEKNYPGKNRGNRDEIGGWRHISIAFTKGKLKIYMDDTRLINIPHYEANPTGLSLVGTYDNLYIKNIRIAKGGVKYYDRVLQDGKIICNGIRFDVNKASLKPESMGPINKIHQLLQKKPDLNFSVEGHTDSDGDDSSNKSLSEARAKVVMEKLIQMGITSNRLKYTGFGEGKPLDNNSTPEGKANNRRVEFVKFTGNTSSSLNIDNSNSAFDKLNRKSIGDKLETLPNDRIQVSIPSGVLLDIGTIIGYATKDGRVGKMEFLNIDKNDNYKLTVKYVTYNFNGSVYSQSDHLEIQGTQNCDLDDGTTEGVTSKNKDFRLGRTNKTNTVIWSGEESILRVLK
ncbi:OmpA family protein [Ancylomarina sp. YFZ004]